MPVIKSAIKKLRQDKKRTAINDKTRLELEVALSSVNKQNNYSSVSNAYARIDKAAKNGILHPNKAARMKAQIAKVAKPVKTTSKKSTPVKKSSSAKSA